MFKTGSKFFYGLAAFAVVTAILFAGFTGGNKIGVDTILGPLTGGWKGYVGDHVGYAILVSLFFVSLSTGILLAVLRDGDAEALAQVVELDVAPEAPAPVMANYWPVIGAFSFACMALGLAVGPGLFFIGVAGFAIVTVEWAIRAWSERATGDPEANRVLRNELMGPIEIPAMAVLLVAAIVLTISRMLLALPQLAALVLFGAVPTLILIVGALVVTRPRLSQSVIAAFLVLGALALLVGGTIAAVVGERDHEDHSSSDTHEGSLAPLPAPSQYVIQVGN
ncbi:MAG: hypothetical protein ABI239_03650 [Aquihabitans sp.]